MTPPQSDRGSPSRRKETTNASGDLAEHNRSDTNTPGNHAVEIPTVPVQ